MADKLNHALERTPESAVPSWRLRAGAALVFLLGGTLAGGGGALSLAPLALLAAIVAAPWRGRLRRPDRLTMVTWGLPAALALWLALTLAWSPTPGAGMRYVKAAGTAAACLVIAHQLHGARRDTIARCVALVGFGAMLALIVADTMLSFPLSRIGREHADEWLLARAASIGVATTALWMWGAALAVPGFRWRSTAVMIALVGLVAVAAEQIDMTAAVVASAFGALAWMAAVLAPRASLRISGGCIGVLLLCSPLLASALPRSAPGVPKSWAQRLEIWESAAAYIREKPILGHGFDSSRAFDAEAMIGGEKRAAIPLHPHNLGLQIWLEGGAVAAILAAAAIAATAWRTASTCDVDSARAYAAVLVAWAVFSMLSFGTWQEWWIAAFGAAVALVGLASRPDPQTRAVDP